MEVSAVSVLICTYNRCARLASALEDIGRLAVPRGCRAEVIVVDNNSTDGTAEVIAEAAARSPIPVRYAHESRQGKSFALNTGLRIATGDVLALTDDDVEPAADWLERIVDAFRELDIVFAGGKVLPRWEIAPPKRLLTKRAQDIWGPLALVDYGDQRFPYAPDAPPRRRPVGANLSVRRDAMSYIGGWRTDLGKVNNTLISGEDHEIYFRLRRAHAYRGVYDPAIVVYHDVPASRLDRRYFRRWFFAAGQARAIMLPEFYESLDFTNARYVAGVPRFIYRELIEQAFRWARCVGREPLERFIQELTLVRFAGLIWQRWTMWATGTQPRTIEIDNGATMIGGRHT